ncbi:MAG TPA: hypothetical protein VHD37_00360 [Candidatus Paceibacterota bacterium]|nr:hypothetical protein [Candidatus Paceibacterota bacterium]
MNFTHRLGDESGLQLLGLLFHCKSLARKMNEGVRSLDVPGIATLKVGFGTSFRGGADPNDHDDGFGRPAYITYRLRNEKGDDVKSPGRALLWYNREDGSSRAIIKRAYPDGRDREYHDNIALVVSQLASGIFEQISFAH